MKRISSLLIISMLIIGISSCKKWLDVNTDPVNPQIATAEVLLSPIEYQMANGTANDYMYIFKYLQYWGSPAAANVWEQHGYEPANDNGGVIWRMLYVNMGLNLEALIADGRKNAKWTYAGIGYAIKAWAFQLATDYHGPIILDQAFDTTRLFFNYQDQPDVYARVRQWCDSAIACFGRPDAISYEGMLSGTSGDQIYKGDRGKWMKFVYGLLAQQYSHLRNKSKFTSGYADSVVKYVDLSFANSSEDATVFFAASASSDGNVFGPTFNLINPTASNVVPRYTGRVAQPIVDLLTGGVRGTPPASPTTSVDPRLSRMIAANPDGVYRGVVPTKGDPQTTKRVPHVWGAVAAPYPGKYLFTDKGRYPLMGYAQLQFAKAEALFAQGKLPEAYGAYLKGIDGHMDFVNTYGIPATATKISNTEITAYKNSSEVAQTAGDLKLSDIMSQKYIAQWGWAGVEQWCDLRKYKYDTSIFKRLYFYQLDDLFPTNKGYVAQRVRPRFNSEYVWNRDELAKWSALNPDYNTYELWFTKPE